MRFIRNFLILTFFLSFSLTFSNSAFAMTSAKNWVNSIKPGTFDIPEEEGVNKASLPNQKEEQKFNSAELRVLTSLRQRENDLKEKEEKMKQKAQELKLLSQQIEQKLDQMRNLQAVIEGRRKERKEMDEKDVSRMVKYYETMAPENTSIFFDQMDRVTAAHLLMRMNPRKASAVMQLIQPKVAVEITEMVTRFKADRQESAK